MKLLTALKMEGREQITTWFAHRSSCLIRKMYGIYVSNEKVNSTNLLHAWYCEMTTNTLRVIKKNFEE